VFDRRQEEIRREVREATSGNVNEAAFAAGRLTGGLAVDAALLGGPGGIVRAGAELRGLASAGGRWAARSGRALANQLSMPSGRLARAGGWMMGGKGIPRGFQPFTPARPVRHHLFPQKYRSWFEARGVKIDKYTFEMNGWGEHSGIHSAGFNQKWAEFIAKEGVQGHPHTTRAILRQGVEMKRWAQIKGRHMPYRD
jgi:hypothetical protein